MSKEKIIIILGVWTAILPYLGFPLSLKNILLSITGLGLVYLGYISLRSSKAGETEEKTFENFSENHNFTETHEGKGI
ncbi:MAG: hypothetical protein WCS86_00935 [Candidatus Paceibacterota bacterium]